MSHPRCPHCGDTLKPFTLPENGGWETSFHAACFNDDCPYYLRGWERMEGTYGVKVSYRYRVDPTSGVASPLAVWSSDAIKDRILDAEICAEPVVDAPAPGLAS